MPKKTIMIIVAAALVAFLAGGGGVYFLMKGELEKASHGQEEVAEPIFYYEISKPLGVNFAPNSSAQFVQTSLAISVEGEEGLAFLKKNEPMIRNNLLMLISAQNTDNLKTREGKEALRKAILDNISAMVKKLSGKSHIKEIFFTSFVMQ